ncbi:MAG TPA: phytanoyl-CoA dioxygenase family protein [Acidimicrobiales bacterium]|nr:phytanoyl-CoA dioxygenase family protein [Acidimicrobiales bacterium]
MLSTAQVDHFQTFGFVVLRGALAKHAAVLEAEVDAAIHDAYNTTFDERIVDGISGHYLPMASRLTPISASLICDDTRLVDIAEQLLGAPALPECPEGVLYFYEADWHNDDGIGVRGVKFAAYFDELTADRGALRFLPGSHHPDYHERLADYRRQMCLAASDGRPEAGRATFPGHVVDTVPGDVVAFDLHTWHAGFGGRDRLAWTIVYQRRPENDHQRQRTLRSMADSFEQAFRGFDRDRYPIWRDWVAEAGSHLRHAQMVERLRADGVLDLPGSDIGW